MTDITELTQSLKAAAEKATPGEWVYFPKNTSIEYDVGSDESQGSILYVDSGDFTQAQTDRNGEFIALANPANILALVEALEKAQRANAAQGDHIEQQQYRIEQLERGNQYAAKRIAELESRTVTVKLPQRYDLTGETDGNCCLNDAEMVADNEGVYLLVRDVKDMLHAAGIKVEAE
ncbi:ead/Ea22-like family protein [Klebsiella variicola]|uniref:ead/Ea22-like family protein n=1 Tax=Klebsiella variicola TaxID=244366 RepID=UPI001A91A595|nr:ead/Ea22-like family protein [Klebsiella variicola]